MAHELLIENGQAAMMYVGEAPWHHLGHKLDKPATSAEAITAARLDWQVLKVPIYLKEESGCRLIKDKYAIVRQDQQESPLGIVGKKYQPLQNQEAFDWFDEIVGRRAAIYHTAGALGHGERVWILAKLNGEIRVKSDDVSEKFLLLSNSHDGGSSIQVKFTPIRVVCQNTLTMALSSGRTLKVGHTANMLRRMDLARINLGIINDRFQKIEREFQQLAEVQMDESRVTDYLATIFPMPDDESNESARNWAGLARRRSSEMFEFGRGNTVAAIRGTLWAAYNGVAEFIDHRCTKQTDSQRLDSIWFGTGYLTKARAFSIAMKKAVEWKN